MKKTKIYFNEELHRYTDEEGRVYISVTTIIDTYNPEKFDNEFWSLYTAIKRSGQVYALRADAANKRIYFEHNGKGRWYEASSFTGSIRYQANLIKEEWAAKAKEATDAGTEKHNYLEDCTNNLYVESNNDYHVGDRGYKFKVANEEQLFNSPLKYTHASIYDALLKLVQNGYTLFAEKRIYSYEHLISGTIDLLAVKGNEFIILDWKTNKDVLKFKAGYYKKVFDTVLQKIVKTSNFVAQSRYFSPPLQNLEYCKGNIYKLQLSLYARLCELWGLKCKGLCIVHIQRKVDENDKPILDIYGKQAFEEPIFYKFDILREEVDLILLNRLKQLS